MAREQWRLRDGRKQRRWGEKELRYQVQGRVWKPKGNTTTQVNTGNEEGPLMDGGISVNFLQESRRWFDRCAYAKVQEVENVEHLQRYFSSIGLYNFKLIPMGEKEVLLEFESNQDMAETIEECSIFLEEKLHDLRPCTESVFAVSHCIWIKVWQIPMGIWREQFFTAVGNKLGTYVCVDAATSVRERVDFARKLVEMTHPILHPFVI